jgi:hypothetical protein
VTRALRPDVPAGPAGAEAAVPQSSRRADQGLRVAGGLIALLAGAGSAVVEAFLVPLRVAGWQLPISPVLAAVLGTPLVAYGAWVTGSRLGAIAPAVGWLGVLALFGTPTAEGDIVVPENLMGLALFFVGAASFLVGVYRHSAVRR